MDFAALAATVDRIDSSVQELLEMVQAIVRPQKAAKPGGKAGGSGG